MGNYECDQCGACCKQSWIEIDHLDVVREPNLLPVVRLMDGNGKIQYDSDWQKEYQLTVGTACPMLGEDNLCTIYPTRPNCCVACEAGSYRCQDSRRNAGLEFLANAQGELPTEEYVEALADWGD